MPPRLPLRARILQQAEPYICRSCLLKAPVSEQARLAEKTRHNSTSSHRPTPRATGSTRIRDVSNASRRASRRYASNGSLASTTAINAPTSVPPAYRELHQRLLALQDTASGYVDLSRIQLAVRSLETSDPVIRVALLGLGSNGALAARKLARVLLSDALGKEEGWENELIASANHDRSLLLRYGGVEDAAQSSPLVQTMNIPSPVIQRNHLEILVTTLNSIGDTASMDDRTALEEAILVPPLTTPNSAGGRVGFVRYPVHKALLVAQGITGAVEFGRLPLRLVDGTLITAALSVPLRPSPSVKSAEEEATGTAVDIDLAQHALDLFRASKANGAEFSNEWQTSRVGTLSGWLAGQGVSDPSSGLNAAVQNLVTSLISGASTSISKSEAADTANTTSATVTDTKRSILQSAISTWSAEAHRDLQLNLDTAFATSPSWRRTSWWRLFWRIDDVTISASDVLRRSWLAEAEQALAFLSGRISEAGLASDTRLRGPTPQLLTKGARGEMETYEAMKTTTETVAQLTQMPSMLSRMQQQSGVNALFNPPWPQTINLSREYMIHTLVPNLHRKAQALLVTTLSTVGGSVALGAWFYVATAGLALYESGAIVALGLVWGLRRLQKRWSRDREEFANTVREDARRVLGEVEGHLRRVVQEGGRVTVRPEDVRSWQEARDALEKCREALGKIRASV